MPVTDPASVAPAAPEARLLRPSATALLAPAPIDATTTDAPGAPPEAPPASTPAPIALREAAAPPAQLLALVCNRVNAPKSKARYAAVLTDFWTWWWGLPAPRPPFDKALVLAYRACRAALAPRTLNVDAAVLRALAHEAADAGLLARDTAATIRSIRGVPVRGKRLGYWLSEEQTQAFVAAPDPSTLMGLRDRAAVGLLFNSGVRRTELVNLDVPHLRRVAVLDKQRQPCQRWILGDIIGKGGRIRSVPIQDLVAAWVQEWLAAAAIADGPIFRGFYKGARLRQTRLSDQAVYDIVKRYGTALGIQARPHGIRRTMGQIADQRGGDRRQIQVTYGHASLMTTEEYLYVDLDLVDAVTDRVPLVPPAAPDTPPR